MTGSRARWRCAAEVTVPPVAIEIGYSGGHDESSRNYGGRLRGSVEREAALPSHAALPAPQPRDSPVSAVRGHLENAADQTSATAMVHQVSLEVHDEVGDCRPAKLRIRRHREALGRAGGDQGYCRSFAGGLVPAGKLMVPSPSGVVARPVNGGV
jgi:hypothetical protein